MHSFRFTGDILRLRLCSLLFILTLTSAAVFLVGAVATLLIGKKIYVWLPVISIAITASSALLYFIFAQSVRCPLCRGTILLRGKCGAHRDCTPLFGSYRFKLAFDALCFGHFRCRFCGEKSKLTTVRKNQQNQSLG